MVELQGGERPLEQAGPTADSHFTALVTGGTGFVGSHVVRRLLAEGIAVRVLARPRSSTSSSRWGPTVGGAPAALWRERQRATAVGRWPRSGRGPTPVPSLEGLPVEMVSGDLREPEGLFAAVCGCRWVFHVAADYRLWCPDPRVLYQANVEGTAALLSAVRAAGDAEKVVYTSTVGALGIPPDGQPGTETTPVSLDDMVGHYKRSKFLAEQEALRFAAEGLPVTLVNPSTPVGPGDWKPTPTGQMIVDFLNGRMPAYVDTGLNLIAVEDVAEGHLRAAQVGRVGEKYILGHRNLTLRKILEILASIAGRPAPRVRIPVGAALLLAHADQFFEGRLLRREPRIPLEGVRMARKRMFFDAAKALGELDLPQTPVEEALRRACAWYAENGYVRGVKT